MKRSREFYIPAALSNRGKGGYSFNITWPSLQGKVAPLTNVQQVTSESVVYVPHQLGVGDVRIAVEFTLATDLSANFETNDMGTGSVTIVLAQGKPLVAFGKISSVNPGIGTFSPQCLSMTATCDASNTTSMTDTVVRGYIYAGVPQYVFPPLASAVQGFTSEQKSSLQCSAREKIKFELSVDANVRPAERLINLKDVIGNMTGSAKYRFLYPEYLKETVGVLGSGKYASNDKSLFAEIPYGYCPPITVIPCIEMPNVPLVVTHFCLRMSNSGPSIVKFPNRAASEVMPSDYERSCVWLGCIVEPAAEGGTFLYGLSDVMLFMRYYHPVNHRVSTFNGLDNNVINCSGSGSALIAEGQLSLAYTNTKSEVGPVDAAVEEANDLAMLGGRVTIA